MSKEQKHTQGEWKASDNILCPGELKGVRITVDGVCIAEVSARKVGSQEIAKANGRIMAAAPALLEALKELHAAVFISTSRSLFKQRVEEVIARAEGTTVTGGSAADGGN